MCHVPIFVLPLNQVVNQNKDLEKGEDESDRSRTAEYQTHLV